ncbi:MAG: phosphate transport system substrate-binding protein [Solirubrobacteraceae bacterium]|jgi:phosphate transport system substrate-binding protein|nr:phosphate transport system substrate-binding protein [Solirubrobacteraceae bacterium]
MRRTRTITALAAAGALALGAAACGSSDKGGGGSSTTGPKGGTISGAGATFPQPVYEEWASRFKDQFGTTVNYNPIGSGGGIAQFTAGTVDFGATDSAMKPEELAAATKGKPVHVPTVFGAITVSYNVSGLDKGLKLDGKTIADLFLGKIKKWDDPAIKALNPGTKLPGSNVTIVHRSDESGTTKLFTSFLEESNPEWKSKVGSDKTVKWPTGTGAKGNDGVAGAVKQTDGAVGYVEEAYALQNNFATADVKNKAGQFVAPTLQSTSAAGEGLQIPPDLRFSAINASANPKAYPIASATFLLVYQDMCKAGVSKDKAQRVVNWLNYAEGDGQKVAPELQYAPLPAQLHQLAQAKVDGLVCNGAPLKGA